jgi:hypothetical protein
VSTNIRGHVIYSFLTISIESSFKFIIKFVGSNMHEFYKFNSEYENEIGRRWSCIIFLFLSFQS